MTGRLKKTEALTYHHNKAEMKRQGAVATKSDRGNLPCKWFLDTTVIIGAHPSSIVIEACVKDKCAQNVPVCKFYREWQKQGIETGKLALFPEGKNNYNMGGAIELVFEIPPTDVKAMEFANVVILKRRGRLHSKEWGGYRKGFC